MRIHSYCSYNNHAYDAMLTTEQTANQALATTTYWIGCVLATGM